MPAYSDYVTPQDFGAPANGVGDDYPAFTAALASGKNLYIPTGNYRLSWIVTIPGGRSVIGSENRPTIRIDVNGGVIFDVSGSDVTIKNIRGDFNNLPNGGGLVRIRNDQQPLERIELTRLIAFGSNGLVYDFPNGNLIVSLTCREVVGRGHRGGGFNFSKVFAYLRMIDCLVDYVGSPSHNHIAYCLQNNQGAFWERCDTTGGQVDASTTSNHGFYFHDCVANWMNNCMADTCGGGGLFLNGGNSHFYVHQFISSLNGTHQYSIVGNDSITLSSCEAGGRQGLPYAPGYPGFVCINTPGMIIDDACRGYNNVGGTSSITNCPNSRINPL